MAVRRALYEELLAKPDTLLLLAFVGDAAVGYGLAHVLAVDDSWIPDTWQTGRGSARSNRSVCCRNTAAAAWARSCSLDSRNTCTASAWRI